MATHPAVKKYIPQRFKAWVLARSRANDFDIMDIVDKHQTPNTMSAVGFLLCIEGGRLGCMLSDSVQPDHRAVFTSPGPKLADSRWHHVALAVERRSATGGKLYVDGQPVHVFDPTGQAGDLSNTEPLRIGNHANPGLKCFFKGIIAGVTIERRAISAEEIAHDYRAGHP